jgi:hypothetical protein
MRGNSAEAVSNEGFGATEYYGGVKLRVAATWFV